MRIDAQSTEPTSDVVLGRSRPRSKLGCQSCKRRRVRCDETKPICGHCRRLSFACVYEPPKPRRKLLQSTRVDGRGLTNESVAATQVHRNPNLGTNSTDSDSTITPVALGAATERLPESSISQVQFPHAEHQNLSDRRREDSLGVNLTPAVMGETATTLYENDFPTLAFGDSHLENFTWHDDDTMDGILALPDSTIYFPTFAFTPAETNQSLIRPNSGLNTAANNESQPISCLSGLSTHESEVMHAADATIEDRHGNAPNLQRKEELHENFLTNSVLLHDTHQKRLLSFFKYRLTPPASLAGVDPLGWKKIKCALTRLAQKESGPVPCALYAVSQLLWTTHDLAPSKRGQTQQKLVASKLHQLAKSGIESGLASQTLDGRNCNTLLAAIFLLAWFEVAYDERDDDRPDFPTSMAEAVIVSGSTWNSSSKRLMQWLALLDAKASHMGGRQLLTEVALDSLMQHRRGPVQDDPQDNLDPTSKDMTDVSDDEETAISGSVDSKQVDHQRLSYLLSSQTAPIPTQILENDVFHSVLQPAFEFHLVSQTYSRRIGAHDRHHRSRDTVEDEYEVMTECRRYETELQDLWRTRPRILGAGIDQLKQILPEPIARRLYRLCSVYGATFWGHFVYLHRVAFWSLKHTPIVQKALEEIGRLMRCSVGQLESDVSFDKTLHRVPSNVIHPGLMWTCFLFGCEVTDPVQKEWAILQLKALGDLCLSNKHPSEDRSDDPSLSHLDDKGARNALKASELLRYAVERQEQTGARVDCKYLCQEKFGYYFYII